MPFQARIAIVGGGPCGLALNQLLHKRGIPSTIYELRPKLTPSYLIKPSGMLDLHEESGLKVIRECGLWEEFQKNVGDCTECCKVMDPDGKVLHMDEGELASRPEIARNALTKILLGNVNGNAIKWDHKLMGVSSTRNANTGATEITLDLGANGTARYDFVIGADGAWSRVRKLLCDAQPFYSGSQFVTATVRNVSTKYPHLLELNGSGTIYALGNGKGIMTHRGPQDSIRVYVCVSTPHERWDVAAGLKGKTAAEAKTLLLSDEKLFSKWAHELKDLVSTAFDEETKDDPGSEVDIAPLYMLPVGHRWEHQAGVTLIGDAAHLMTPWAGEGVNLALWDSLDLAAVLGEVPTAEDAAAWQAALEPRLRDFEEAMLARAQEKAEESVSNNKMLMSENGAQAFADFFKAAYEMMAAGNFPGKESNR